jgi:eukaryotic-like serine/threonine-protein kinase
VSDLSQSLQEALNDRYRIERQLGRGGMATVFLAEDLKHHRRVAIKVLDPEVAVTVGPERFRLEIETVARLTHPHILPLFESGQAEGLLFYAMPYAEGGSLRDRLTRERQLAVEDALRITREVADALDEAHRHGIVHRDIKPENVLFEGRHAVVADFGIARAVTTATGESLTATGITVGTPAYTSPEQAAGGRNLDGRSDLYSLACVLYEMLAGQPPFTGPTAESLAHQHLSVAPRAVTELRPTVPATTAATIQRALAKNPADRFATTAEFALALQAGTYPAPAPGTARPPDQPRSIAVLPLTNLSADPEQEYFSDGLAEDIIDALTQVPGLRVVARTSAFSFRGKQADAREIGARLNVEHILEGSVRRSGNRIRVTAQLVKVSDGYQLWSQRFDREMTDVFAIQDEISQAVVEKLRVRLTGSRPLVKRHTQDVEAYNLYLKARYQLMRFSPEGIAKSKEYYEQAIASDPNYALAWHGLAEFHHLMALFGLMPPKAANDQAEQAARRALQLDDQLAEAHAMKGALRACEFDWQGAGLEFSRALALDPTSGEVRTWYDGNYLAPMKRLDEAVAACLRSVELDPLSPYLQWCLGYDYCLQRDWDRAIKQCLNTLELDPQNWGGYVLLGSCYLHVGRRDDAIRAMETQAQVAGRSALALGSLGWAYGVVGRTAEASKLLAELQERAHREYIPFWSFAVIHVGLGEVDRACDWFEKAIDEHEPVMLHARVHPNYDRLRAHPRYPDLLRKMNLEP